MDPEIFRTYFIRLHRSITQMEKQFSCGAEFKHEVQVLLRPEGLNEVADEWVLQPHQNLALENDLLELALLNELFD